MKARAVLDIGSNSVRMMLEDGNGGSDKLLKLTQLGKGLSFTGKLKDEGMSASIDAIKEFVRLAGNADVYAFATEAVRKADNGKQFLEAIYKECGISVELLSGEEEALAGYLGATGGVGEGTVIDIGGASTELVSGLDNCITNAVSVPLGAVKLKDLCGDNEEKIEKTAKEILPDFPVNANVTAIGGTATTIGCIKLRLNKYDKKLIHGLMLSREDVECVKNALIHLSVEERVIRFPVLPVPRAEVIACGAVLLHYLMLKYDIKKLKLSDSDNTEGFLLMRSL